MGINKGGRGVGDKADGAGLLVACLPAGLRG